MNLSSGTQSIIAGALFDFMGRLTTLPKTIKTGDVHTPHDLLDVFTVWAKERGLSIEKAMVQDWDTLPGEVTLASLSSTDGLAERRILGALVSYLDYLRVAETDDYEGALLRWASKTGLEISNPQERWSSVWWA